jgi:ABC-type dipeptide/oligopeptide/nickel transport system ATPase subunit
MPGEAVLTRTAPDTPEPSADGAELRVVGLGKVFGRKASSTWALRNVDLTIGLSERVGIVGESGSGKTTLGRILVGLAEPSTGQVLFCGTPLSDVLRRKRTKLEFCRTVQYVAQDTGGSFEPGKRCGESVAFPARYLQVASDAEIRADIDDLINAFEVPHGVLSRFPGELSGGERQRLSLIRGLAARPRMLICDEVVSALDVAIQAKVLNVLKAHSLRRRVGLMFIAHGLPATAFIAERIAVMRLGEIVEQGPTPAIIGQPREPYTRELIDAFNVISGSGSGVRG